MNASPLPFLSWPTSTLSIGFPFWLTTPAAKPPNSCVAKPGSTSAGQISVTVKPGSSANPLGAGVCSPQSILTCEIGPADLVVVDPQAAHVATNTAASAAAVNRLG
jgi:hypothetical protein